MPTSNVTAEHAEYIVGNSGAGGSLEDSAGMVDGNVAGNTANTWIPTYFLLSSFNLYYNYRAFAIFDLSSLSGTATGVTLTLYRRTNATTPLLYFMAADCSDAVGTTDYLGGIVGFDNTGDNPYEADGLSSLGDGGKLYTDSPWNPNADGGTSGDAVTITLNSNAITDVNSAIGSGKFKLVVVNTYDFNNTYGSSGLSNLAAVQGAYFSSTQDGDSAVHPVLNVTTSGAATPDTTISVNSGKIITNGGSIKINQ